MSCVCHAFASVHCCFVVTCWERIHLLALVCDVWLCFVTFPCVILGQVWYLIVSMPDLCHISYFNIRYYSSVIKYVPKCKTYFISVIVCGIILHGPLLSVIIFLNQVVKRVAISAFC